MRKQFITLFIVLSLALTGVIPAFASQTAIGSVTLAQSSPDVLGEILSGLPQGFGTVRADDLALELVETPPFLLDVREPGEWDEGHIEGAVHIPLREVAQNLELLPAALDAPLVVYCKSGHRGAQAMFSLQLLGYTNVRSLAGGIVAWQNAGYEVTTEAAEVEAGAGPAVDADVLAQVDAYLSGIPEGFYTVRAEDLALELVETPPFLLDVREQSEWDKEGYIEGAVHIPLRELFANLDALPEDLDAPIVVYCKSGHRGALAMTALQYYGYENVRNLNGGVLAWQAAGYELAGGAAAMAEVDVAGAVDAFLSALPQGFGTVSADDLALELVEDDAPFLLDVREQSEWDEDGYIEGAVHIPLREIAAYLDLLPAFDTPIVVYCKSGHRGALAMMALQLLGYENVRSLAGGIVAWQNAGYEIVTD